MSCDLKVVPAAQYLRMSTDLQQYSIDNQEAVIREYATRQGFRVVRTYTDSGKTGVVLKYRRGLANLLHDAMSGTADYEAILVYDVSRWGRFQDIDESAHYEFVCRTAGIPIYYCAESFANDFSIQSSIFKALKRTMAAEMSREQGIKVHAGQKRLVELGYRMGSSPGYALRRLLVSSTGKPKQILATGERKSLSTDRVVLTMGPPDEIRIVKKVFSQYLKLGKGYKQIAAELNRAHIPYVDGRLWTSEAVLGVLINPKYTGDNLWGRTSARLYTETKHVERNSWIIGPTYKTVIVDRKTFERVQRERERRRKGVPNETILTAVRKLLSNKGRLSQSILDRSRNIPSSPILYRRFGNLTNLYRLVGFKQSASNSVRTASYRRSYAMRIQIMEEIKHLFGPTVTEVRVRGRNRKLLRFHGLTDLSIKVCTALETRQGICWNLVPEESERNSVTLLALMDRTNARVREFYLLDGFLLKKTMLRPTSAWLRGQPKLPELCALVNELTHRQQNRITSPQGF